MPWIDRRRDETLLCRLLADAERRADLRPRAPVPSSGGDVAIEQLVGDAAHVVGNLDRSRQSQHRIVACRAFVDRCGELIDPDAARHVVNLGLTHGGVKRRLTLRTHEDHARRTGLPDVRRPQGSSDARRR